MTISLLTLRTADAARQAEWPNAEKITAIYRALELGGEVGEALNIVKKLERERLGIPGSRATVSDLALELADILQCVDLLAMEYDIDLSEALVEKFNAITKKIGLTTFIQHEPTLDAATLKNMLRRAYQYGQARYTNVTMDQAIACIVHDQVKEELTSGGYFGNAS